MVKRQCDYCSFEGHGYEHAAHFAKAHLGTIHIKICEVRELPSGFGYALLELPDGKRVSVTFKLPERSLQKVQVWGEWVKQS